MIAGLNGVIRMHFESELRLSGIPVRADPPEMYCIKCGAKYIVIKTTHHEIVDNTLNTVNGWWPVSGCPNGCIMDGKHERTVHLDKHKNLAKANHRFSYALEARVGMLRYMEHKQLCEIREMLADEGKIMSESSISRYSREFVDDIEKLHALHLPKFKEVFAGRGGYLMQFDSTCEKGSGSLFHVVEGMSKLILGAWRQSTENAEEMIPHVLYLTETIGAPRSIMKDLSKQGRLVAAVVVKAYPDANIIIFACHYHFNKDIGKDILKAQHNALKECIRGIKATLGRYIRETCEIVGDDADSIEKEANEWINNPGAVTISSESEGAAIVRYLMQWILDSVEDGDGGQFPFELPYLLFYDRVVRMSKISELLSKGIGNARRSPTCRLLKRLNKVTSALAEDSKAANIAEKLRAKNELFLKLRAIMRLENGEDLDEACPTVDKYKEYCDNIKDEFEAYLDDLRKMLASSKVSSDVKKAARVIIQHAKKYGDELWGHVIPVADEEGNISYIVADRTNDICEQIFAFQKTSERRNSGRKNLGWELEKRPAAVSLIINLESSLYLDIVCGGSIYNLPRLFSDMENGMYPDLDRMVAEYRKTATTVFESGRLPRKDLKIIRSKEFEAKISSLQMLCS